MPEVVGFPDITESFKRAMHEVLSGFFDGNTHTINDIEIEFPQADIRFDVRLSERPVGLTIVLNGTGVTNQRDLKCSNPQASELHGNQLRAEIVRRVHIAIPKQGGTNNNNSLEVDKAWDKLHAVFTQYSLFSSRNIFLPTLVPVPEELNEREDIAEVFGLFNCEIRASFARYNT